MATMDMNFLSPVNNSTYNLMSQITEDIQNTEVTGDFKKLIEMMMPLFAMQTFTSSGGIESLEDAGKIHINQFDAEISVGGDGANANCGPTSLAIGLHALGIPVLGEGTITNSGLTVDLARKSMVADAARDGMGANGQRLESEHSTWTNFEDLDRGARAAGAKTGRITATAKDVMESLVGEGIVIVSGTFTGKYPLPWTGDRGVDNQSAPGNATGHIVAVTGYDPSSGAFIVNDPARKEPLIIDAKKLDYFMQGKAGAIEIRRE
ncbi:MAG: C39 family peptidase [Anaerolineaceae bacterium]|nr:C39 family peptidase [Anaerolineaceae bacterium]